MSGAARRLVSPPAGPPLGDVRWLGALSVVCVVVAWYA